MELTVIVGLIVGIGGILLGNIIEGGHIASLIQGAAAVIVLSGTAGAVIVSSKKRNLFEALSMAKNAFFTQDLQQSQLLNQIIDLARQSKKDSLLSLEPSVSSLKNSFLKDVIRAAVDGVEPALIRKIFEKKIQVEEELEMASAKVWVDAGGFAPTIGIIGAVLGLIHVMGNLSDTSKLGSGIAVAFVATVYGVGFANLVFLPLGARIKKSIEDESRLKEMMLEGGIGIAEGLNPALLEVKLKAYLEDR